MKQQKLAILLTGAVVLLIMTFYLRFWAGLLFVIPLGLMAWKESGQSFKFPAKETPKPRGYTAPSAPARPVARPASYSYGAPATYSHNAPYVKEFELLGGQAGELPLSFSITRGGSTFSVQNVLDLAKKYIEDDMNDPEILANMRGIYSLLYREYKSIGVPIR